jgi:hypothetical protein
MNKPPKFRDDSLPLRLIGSSNNILLRESGVNRRDLSIVPRLASRVRAKNGASSAYAAPSAGACEGSALAGSCDLGVDAFREVREVSR